MHDHVLLLLVLLLILMDTKQGEGEGMEDLAKKMPLHLRLQIFSYLASIFLSGFLYLMFSNF